MAITQEQVVKASTTFSYITRRPVTPTNFLDFISTFRKLLNQKNTYIRQKIQKLAYGLNRTEGATKEVEEHDEKTLLAVDDKKKLQTKAMAEEPIKRGE